MVVKIHLGQRVRSLREEKGWTQSDLAALIPGVRQQSIDQLERGHVKRPRFLPELAQALGASLQWLLTGEGNRTANKKKSEGVDAVLLRDVLVAVDQVLSQRSKKIGLQEKAKLISALYDLMLSEGGRNAKKLEEAAGNIIGYDKFLKKAGKGS